MAEQNKTIKWLQLGEAELSHFCILNKPLFYVTLFRTDTILVSVSLLSVDFFSQNLSLSWVHSN